MLFSPSAWLTGYDDPLIDKINQRIEDLTGLEMDTAEEMQVELNLVFGKIHNNSNIFVLAFHKTMYKLNHS